MVVLYWSNVMLNDAAFGRSSMIVSAVETIPTRISLCTTRMYPWPELSSMNSSADVSYFLIFV